MTHEGKKHLANALAYIKKNSDLTTYYSVIGPGSVLHQLCHSATVIADYVTSLEARVAELEDQLKTADDHAKKLQAVIDEEYLWA